MAAPGMWMMCESARASKAKMGCMSSMRCTMRVIWPAPSTERMYLSPAALVAAISIEPDTITNTSRWWLPRLTSGVRRR